MTKDTLSKLEPVSFRGIRFPCIELATEFTHDIAEHKEPDTDGAFLEATGRGPRLVTLRIPFRNGLGFYKNPYTAPLYPNQFRAFEAACANRATGDFVHPVRGKMRVKVVSFKDTLSGESGRDGVTVDVTLKETLEATAADTQEPSPIALAKASAATLDAELPRLRARKPGLAVPQTFSFSDAVNLVQSATSRVALLQKQAFASIDRTLGLVGAVEDAIVSLHDVTLTNARLATERLRYALETMQAAITKDKTASMVLRVDATAAQVARLTKNSLADILTLNPALAGNPRIRAGTTVLHYA